MIYDYKCGKCNATISVERSIHETMSRVWDSPAITFKGKGFYTTGG
jgi:predicted nucleic acid-binding Zn ribbon protein